MNDLTQDFFDLISGKNPKFEKIVAIYPEFQVEFYEWKVPFKEGAGKDDIDETTIRVGTIHNNKIFYECYVLTPTDSTTKDDIIRILKTKLKHRILNYDYTDNNTNSSL